MENIYIYFSFSFAKIKSKSLPNWERKQKYVPKNYAMIYFIKKSNWSWNGTETGVSFIIHIMNKTLRDIFVTDIYAGCWCFLCNAK